MAGQTVQKIQEFSGSVSHMFYMGLSYVRPSLTLALHM